MVLDHRCELFDDAGTKDFANVQRPAREVRGRHLHVVMVAIACTGSIDAGDWAGRSTLDRFAVLAEQALFR